MKDNSEKKPAKSDASCKTSFYDLSKNHFKKSYVKLSGMSGDITMNWICPMYHRVWENES